jgi:hypothetical protein
MPNRTILNKYGLFVSQVHKVLKKKEHSREDAEVINKARLVATLCSNHSWRVYRFLHCGEWLNSDSMRDEINAAYNEGWKEISENDVKEVATYLENDHAISKALLCIDCSKRKEYKELLTQFQKEFVDGIEPIESREMC